jgi:hypothetical protein
VLWCCGVVARNGPQAARALYRTEYSTVSPAQPRQVSMTDSVLRRNGGMDDGIKEGAPCSDVCQTA